MGTGCIIGPNLVLTCAHNLAKRRSNGARKYSPISFVPSQLQKQVLETVKTESIAETADYGF